MPSPSSGLHKSTRAIASEISALLIGSTVGQGDEATSAMGRIGIPAKSSVGKAHENSRSGSDEHRGRRLGPSIFFREPDMYIEAYDIYSDLTGRMEGGFMAMSAMEAF